MERLNDPLAAGRPARGVIRRGEAGEGLLPGKAAIILPTLNEVAGLSATLQELPIEMLRRNGWDVRLLVIDGGSTDGTCEVAAEYGVKVLRQRSRGKGAAIHEALQYLGKAGIKFAAILDADATYPGRYVYPALELLASGTDVVVGVRERKPPMDPTSVSIRDFVHRTGNALLNLSAELLSGCSLLDICSGFWAVRIPEALALDLQSTDFAIEAELFLKARRSGLTVNQFPIEYRERIGEAKLHATRDGLRILAAIVRFGRRSVGVTTDRIRRRLSRLLRELFLILLIEGPRDVVLVASPERRVEASVIAARLRRARLATTVRIDSRGSGEGLPVLRADPTGAGTAIVSLWDDWEESPLDGPHGSWPPTVRFLKDRRQIFIDLPVTDGTSDEPAPTWPRNGGVLAEPGSEDPRWLQAVRFLARELRQESPHTPSMMLQINGIRAEPLRSKDLPRHLAARGFSPPVSRPVRIPLRSPLELVADRFARSGATVTNTRVQFDGIPALSTVGWAAALPSLPPDPGAWEPGPEGAARLSRAPSDLTAPAPPDEVAEAT